MKSWIFLIAFNLLVSTSGFSQDKVKLSGDEVFKKNVGATVFIIAPTNVPNPPAGKPMQEPVKLASFSVGSGFFVGYTVQKRPVILTNYHVIDKGQYVRFVVPKSDEDERIGTKLKMTDYQTNYNSGTKFLKAILKDTAKDLALLEVDGDLPVNMQPVVLAKDSPGPGATVFSIGCSPSSGMWSTVRGAVRAVAQRDFLPFDFVIKPGQKIDINNIKLHSMRTITTDSAINKGDSGGPLFNEYGELVGMAQSKAVNADSVSNFVDIRELKAALDIFGVKYTRAGEEVAVAAKTPSTPEPAKPAPTKEMEKEKKPVETEPTKVASKKVSFVSIDTASLGKFEVVAATPLPPISLDPNTCLYCKSGYLLKVKDAEWTFKLLSSTGIAEGKLKLESEKDWLWSETGTKLKFRYKNSLLEYAEDGTNWKTISESAKWQAEK